MVLDSRLPANVNDIFKFHQFLLFLNIHPCLLLVYRVGNGKLVFDDPLKVFYLANRKLLWGHFDCFYILIDNCSAFARIANKFLNNMNFFLLLFLSIKELKVKHRGLFLAADGFKFLVLGSTVGVDVLLARDVLIELAAMVVN